MIDWISVEDGLPEELKVVEVCGEPYSNHGIVRALAIYDSHLGWLEADNSFGWILKFVVNSGNDMRDLENVTHWKSLTPLPTKTTDTSYKGYRIFKDTVSQTYRIMLCQDNIAQDFKTSDEAKLFIDDLIEVEGNE